MLTLPEACSSDLIFKIFRDECAISNHVLKFTWENLIKEKGARQASYIRCVNAEYQMRHTAPLLKKAYEVSSNNNDVVNSNYFLNHYYEEKDHHNWGVSDLYHAKNDLFEPFDSLDFVKPLKTLVELQYQSLESGDLLTFLGYIVALEGFPGNSSYWKNFSDNHSLNIKAFSSPIKHASLDKLHSKELFIHIYERYSFANDISSIVMSSVSSIIDISKSFRVID